MTLTGAGRLTVQQQALAGYRRAQPAPVVTVAPTGGTRWVDASNYTGDLSDQQCQDLLNAGVVGVIVQAITSMAGVSNTRQQLEACVRNGLRVAGYVWCFPGASVGSRLHMFDGYQLDFLALDVEDTNLSTDDVDRDLGLCDAYSGKQTWLYTGKWFFDQMGWSGFSWWAARPLWDAHYDGTPVANDHFVPYGGWTKCAIEQWWGTSDIGHVHEIDQDVMAT